jgi:serine/threonine-protein kinase
MQPGVRLGPYEILSALGAGGMGEVYRARDGRLSRDVAIKVLPAELAGEPERRSRLLREARAAASLSHPHICTIYDVGEADGHAFVAMELIDGQPLSTRLAARALTSDEVVRYGLQLASALAHAHAHGVVHRDLKSANVMLTPSDDVKVVDFGLAKRIASPEMTETVTHAPASLTEPGTIVGTLAYMSPEQFRGEPADARSDVWALGVMLYEMATGTRPFAGQTGFALSAAVMHDAPAPLPSRVPAALQTIVKRCLEKEPARRYQHGGEVRAALEMVPAVAGATPPASGTRRLSPMVVAGMSVAAVAIVTIVAMATLGRFSTGAPRPSSTPDAVASTPAIRLAVMPFENLTGDARQDYFSDGLTEEMIAQLGSLAPQRLRVIGRTSVMRYKGGATPVDQIGRELGVDYILSGSARRDASRVRVVAQLAQVRDQAQLWSETYDRDLADILSLQNEVAQRVARGLALQLLPAGQRKTAPVNPEAYDLYLQGRAQLNSGPLALDRAQQLFERALQQNPGDALSYAGIAAVWQWRGIMQFVRGKDASARGKAAATKAVELDDSLADSHAALANAYVSELDWPRAEIEFKRALEINPNHADSHAAYAMHLAMNARSQDAMTQIEWAAALDPFNGMIRLAHGMALLAGGRFDDVVRELRLALTSSPGIAQYHWVLWRTLHAEGNDKDALAEIIALSKMLGDPEQARTMEQGDAAGGYREAMHRAAALLESRAKVTRPLNPAFLALVHHDAGNRDKAFAWMERAIEDGDPNLPTMGILAPDLKDDSRFRDLMRRIGLPY